MGNLYKNGKINDIYQKGGWGQNFMKTNYIFTHLHDNFQYFPYFWPKLSIKWSQFSLNYTDFYSILVEIHHLLKKNYQKYVPISLGFFIFFLNFLWRNYPRGGQS